MAAGAPAARSTRCRSGTRPAYQGRDFQQIKLASHFIGCLRGRPLRSRLQEDLRPLQRLRRQQPGLSDLQGEQQGGLRAERTASADGPFLTDKIGKTGNAEDDFWELFEKRDDQMTGASKLLTRFLLH